MAWSGDASLSGLEIKGEGRPPSGSDEVAIDKASADRENFAVGDTIEVITDTGTHPFTITALVGLGDSDGFAGATLAAAAMRAGLIDEYAIVTHPVLVGGGRPFFTTLDNWVNLNLVETRTFPDGVLLTRYETRR